MTRLITRLRNLFAGRSLHTTGSTNGHGIHGGSASSYAMLWRS